MRSLARMLVKDDMNRRLPPYDHNIFLREIMSPEMAEGMHSFLEKLSNPDQIPLPNTRHTHEPPETISSP